MDESISSNNGPPNKKKRQGRRNNDQINYLVDYLLLHPTVASGKFTTMNARDAIQGSWEELVKQLNDMRSMGQSEKNVKSWKESWRDQKTKTSKKVGAIRRERLQTGNQKLDLLQLTDLDKKVLSIIGKDYVEGTSCPDSWPEEQENNVQRMADGDNSIYLIEPSTLPVDEENNLDAFLDNIENETIICENMTVAEKNVSLGCVSTNNSEQIPERVNQNNLSNPPSFKRPRMVKQKLSSQLQTARHSFNVIAEKQADATKLMADSLSVVGKALEKMADNDEKRIVNEKKLLELYEKILDKI